MEIKKIKRDPEFETKYSFDITEIIIFAILFLGILGFMFIIRQENKIQNLDNENQIKIINQNQKDFKELIEK